MGCVTDKSNLHLPKNCHPDAHNLKKNVCMKAFAAICYSWMMSTRSGRPRAPEHGSGSSSGFNLCLALTFCPTAHALTNLPVLALFLNEFI